MDYSEQQIEDIAARAAKKAVQDVLLELGIDTKNPLETQETMAFMRRFKKMCESASLKIVTVVVGVITLLVLGLLGLSSFKG